MLLVVLLIYSTFYSLIYINLQCQPDPVVGGTVINGGISTVAATTNPSLIHHHNINMQKREIGTVSRKHFVALFSRSHLFKRVFTLCFCEDHGGEIRN